MLFDDLDIKFEYDSRRSNVYYDFFNKILPHSNHYQRFGGLFSGKKFASFAEGLQEFIKENDGRMQLAIIPIFSKEDKEALLQGISQDDIIVKNWIRDFSEIKDKFTENYLKALSWMVANGRLEIKLILPRHEDGTLLSEIELKNFDIFRREIGIFYNKDNGEPLSFHGTIDKENMDLGEFYQIYVSRQWIESEKDRITSDYDGFNNFWNNDVSIGSIHCQIRPLSAKLLDYFKENSPKSKEDIPPLRKLPALRRYQNDAIKAWYENGGRGIFEMATGTGKTFTAIGCIKKLETVHDKLLVVIAAPYTNLIEQWREELSKWFIDSIVLDKGWTRILRDEIRVLNTKEGSFITVLICSHAKFATDEFLSNVEKCRIPTMLIVDEAHHVGAGSIDRDEDGILITNGARKGLSEKYQYRLALSATIERYFDDDGTDILKNYFTGTKNKSTVAYYDLKQAIADEKLCPYNYYPNFVELTSDEFIEYKKITYRAVRLLKSKHPDDRIKGEDLIKMRAKIIRDASQKMNAFKEIMKEFTDIKHLLVFCSENQFNLLYVILNNPDNFNYKKSIVFRKITYDDPKKKKDRINILKDFANEDYDMILSNRVLDEGMDIPQAKRCIVLASTGNPAQFIQRRGRVLRRFDDKYKDGSRKMHADIYDVLVKPTLNGIEDPDSIKLEIGIIKSQLKQIRLMSELAMNKEYCMRKILELTQNLPEEVFQSN